MTIIATERELKYNYESNRNMISSPQSAKFKENYIGERGISMVTKTMVSIKRQKKMIGREKEWIDIPV